MRRRIHSWTHGMVLGSALAASLAMGCATTGSLTRADVFRHYDALAQLNAGVDDARSRQSGVLAPEQQQKTQASLETAITYAQNGEKDKANEAATRGIEELGTLNHWVEVNGRVMECKRRFETPPVAGLNAPSSAGNSPES